MVDSLYGIPEESKTIWVFLENNGEALERVSMELLNKGRRMAGELEWELHGLLLGSGIQHLAGQAFSYGADQVWLADHPLLEEFSIEAYGAVAFDAIMAGKPSVFLCGATPNGRDLAGRLAVRLRTGLNADCTNLHMDGERGILVSEVSGFGGGVLALIEMADHRPQMATVRPGVFPPAIPSPDRRGKIVRLPFDLGAETVHTRRVEKAISEGVDLTQAENLVVGGRGMGGDFTLVKELAALIGGEYGTTRPPVDEGQVERERMIGQTGVVCRPRVAICCGISGAFHFIVGIQEAETVIAINTDPKAPIFDHADFCVIGDVHEVLPALIQALNSSPESAPTPVAAGGQR